MLLITLIKSNIKSQTSLLVIIAIPVNVEAFQNGVDFTDTYIGLFYHIEISIFFLKMSKYFLCLKASISACIAIYS